MARQVENPDLNCLSIPELELRAYENMDKQTRDYYNEGSDDGMTNKENNTAYNKYRIRPRVLRDVSIIDTSTNVFGFQNSVPFGVAPAAMQGLAHDDGEVATARACRKAKIVMGLSSFSTRTLEEVGHESGEIPNIMQLYLFEEKAKSKKLIARAKQAGYKAIALTVDTPLLGRRIPEIRNQFKLPSHLRIANFQGGEGGPKVEGAIPSQSGYTDENGKRVLPKGPISFHTHAANPTLNWDVDIPWLIREAAPMQVWAKGIATGEDALLAMKYGCHGIIVSNHGGRQLNGALATVDALPGVVEAVGGKIPIHVDGGIRHGTDIFKALALGADFVWVGRPILWGLAYKGQEGVELCLKLLSDEIKLCMGLAGVTKVDQITKEYIMRMDRDGFLSKL